MRKREGGWLLPVSRFFIQSQYLFFTSLMFFLLLRSSTDLAEIEARL